MIVVAHLLLGIMAYWLNFRKIILQQLVQFSLHLDKIVYQSLLLYLYNEIATSRFAKGSQA